MTHQNLTPALYTLCPAKAERLGLLFNSPHSGRYYPPEFVASSALDLYRLRSSEDAFVDQLFGFAPKIGAWFMHAAYPRVFIDLNRHPNELDPAVIEGVSISRPSPKLMAGLGVIPRVVAGQRCIYAGKISQESALERIATYYHPYHARLKALLQDLHRRHGKALLIDCHSMPFDAIKNQRLPNGALIDIALGDCHGKTAPAWIMGALEGALTAHGFHVARNHPYAGGHITSHYGQAEPSLYAMQIEVARHIYMDETTITPLAGFAAVQARLKAAFEAFFAEIAAWMERS